MNQAILRVLTVFFILALLVPAAFAGDDDQLAGSGEYVGAYNYSGAYEQAHETAQDTAYFDGGDGSTINTSVSQEYPLGDVPEVGEGVPVEE